MSLLLLLLLLLLLVFYKYYIPSYFNSFMSHGSCRSYILLLTKTNYFAISANITITANITTTTNITTTATRLLLLLVLSVFRAAWSFVGFEH